MKKSIFYAFILAASVWAAGCGKAKQPLELVTDQYGVAYKVNPSEKNVYLVFTGHYSTDDDGHFENFDGADDVLKIMAEHDVKGPLPTGYKRHNIAGTLPIGPLGQAPVALLVRRPQ